MTAVLYPEDTNAIARKRQAFIAAFYRYLADDPLRAVTDIPSSVGVLAERLASGWGSNARTTWYEPDEKPWAASTVRDRWPGPFEEAWNKLCASTEDHFLAAQGSVPDKVSWRIDRYRSSVGPENIPPATGYDLDSFNDWSDTGLRNHLRTADDINSGLAAARVLVDRHIDVLRDHDYADTDTTLQAADTLIGLGDTALARISPPDTELLPVHPTPTSIRHYCIPVFNATSDALRVMSRDPLHEAAYLKRLVTFRERDLALTAPYRRPIDKVLVRYYVDAATALLTDVGPTPTGNPRSDSQIQALNTALDRFTALSASGPEALNELNDDTVRSLAGRLAALGLAFPHRRDDLCEMAVTLLHLVPAYPLSSNADYPTRLTRRHLRTEISLLLRQSNLRHTAPERFLRPPQMLSLTRYIGVGDLLLADALLRIANDPRPGHAISYGATQATDIAAALKAHEDVLEPFLGPWVSPPLDRDDPEDQTTAETRSHARNALRFTARDYYDRAAGWFRQLGAAGVLRERAVRARNHLDAIGYRPTQESTSSTLSDLTTPLTELAYHVDIVIARAITDFSREHVRAAAASHIALTNTLSHAALISQNPRAATIRSDLAPNTFGVTRPHATAPLAESDGTADD